MLYDLWWIDVEEWRDIPEYEGLYQVSSFGRVKSLERKVRNSNGGLRVVKERILNLALKKNGYLQIGLYKEGIQKFFKVHRLVSSAFLFNQGNNLQVNHINGNKTDNRVENLEWCTSSENIKHAFSTGLRSHKGERHSQNKLTKKQVLEIRKKYATGGYLQRELAEEYEVARTAISHIVRRKNWKHI